MIATEKILTELQDYKKDDTKKISEEALTYLTQLTTKQSPLSPHGDTDKDVICPTCKAKQLTTALPSQLEVAGYLHHHYHCWYCGQAILKK